MSLKFKFYSTTAREITLKKKKGYVEEAERESAYMPGSKTALVKFGAVMTSFQPIHLSVPGSDLCEYSAVIWCRS